MTPDELRDLRGRLGWTQAIAAEHLGMSHRGYRYIEEGKTSSGVITPVVPPPLAIAMLALNLAAEIDEAHLPSERLARFAWAVKREANLRPPPVAAPAVSGSYFLPSKETTRDERS